MGRPKGSSNKKNDQRTDFIKVRVSPAFMYELKKCLMNQFYGTSDYSNFVRDAIAKHILYSSRDITRIDQDALRRG